MSETYRRTIPLIITAIFFIYMIVEYFFAIPTLKDFGNNLQSYTVIVIAFAVGIGAISSIRLHISKVLKKDEDWWMSIWLLFLLVTFAVVGIFLGQGNLIFKWLYDNIYSPLSSTTYSILAFFITSAAFRAFRARNLEASVMLLSGSLVLIGNMPASASVWTGFPVILEWILNVPTTGAIRVINMGGALGMITMALRILLGRERGFLGGGEE